MFKKVKHNWFCIKNRISLCNKKVPLFVSNPIQQIIISKSVENVSTTVKTVLTTVKSVKISIFGAKIQI